MNLPTLDSVAPQDIKKYLPYAIQLSLRHKLPPSLSLSRKEKIIVSKLHYNLARICKLSVKEIKELIKIEPLYQQALGDLFFDKTINNYFLIAQHQQKITKPPSTLVEQYTVPSQLVVDIQHRIEFTVSNIEKKNIMKPVVLIVMRLQDGRKVSVYVGMQQFGSLRQKVANAMRQVFGVELRAM